MSHATWELFNCYEELKVWPAASPQEIRKARNHAAALHHPDRGGSHDAQVRINLAYQVLSNPIARQSHDIHWRIYQPNSIGSTAMGCGDTQPASTEPEPRAKGKSFGGFGRRVYDEIDRQKEVIWRDLNIKARKNEADYLNRYSNQSLNAFLTFLGLIAFSALALHYSVFWVFAICLGCFCLSTLAPVKIANRAFSIIDPNAVYNLRELAYQSAKQSCAANLKKVEAYLSSLATISQILFRPSTLDDSEEQIARRLAVAFFLMGYIPALFDKLHRTITFTDGGELIMARFRHREGGPTTTAYVEEMVELMTQQGISRGFLFCSSGLSENADNYAQKMDVIWYQLENMNEWINQVLKSDYSGPAGEALDNLDKLHSFIGHISTEFTARSYTS